MWSFTQCSFSVTKLNSNGLTVEDIKTNEGLRCELPSYHKLFLFMHNFPLSPARLSNSYYAALNQILHAMIFIIYKWLPFLGKNSCEIYIKRFLGTQFQSFHITDVLLYINKQLTLPFIDNFFQNHISRHVLWWQQLGAGESHCLSLSLYIADQ